jgi:hypothetical protein
MIFVIRGHIRDTFRSGHLYNLIETLYHTFPDLKIFIHTWNIVSNNISWREEITTNNEVVNNEVIYNYFGNLSSCIKHIIIDDDTNIQLNGNLFGNINGGPMPIIGWKNYWYGKHKIIDYIYNNFNYSDEMIVNTRFDVLDNSHNFNTESIVDFIKNNIQTTRFEKNVFFYNYESNGVDNIYIGNINTMYKLANKFFYELDDILSKNSDTIHQERLVYRINDSLFDQE